jgi:hypothetical protein
VITSRRHFVDIEGRDVNPLHNLPLCAEHLARCLEGAEIEQGGRFRSLWRMAVKEGQL